VRLPFQPSTTARVVAMAVRFYAEFGAVKAFTRGALCLSDNFDTVAGRVAAVENFAFGGAKTYLEHAQAHRFVSDHMQWPDARVLASLPVLPNIHCRQGQPRANIKRPRNFAAFFRLSIGS
jgi:hypothetical protein